MKCVGGYYGCDLKRIRTIIKNSKRIPIPQLRIRDE